MAVGSNPVEVIRTLLNSARQSVESARLNSARAREASAGMKEILVQLEAARVALGAIGIIGGSASLSETLPGLHDFIFQLSKITEGPLATVAENIHFELHGDHARVGGVRKAIPLFKERQTIAKALRALVAVAQSIIDEAPHRSVELELINLKFLVPEQKVAAAQFGIENDRLVVAKKSSVAETIDLESIEYARATLERGGEAVIQELDQSNCDRRLIAALKVMQEHLVGAINSIQLGLAHMKSEAMYDEFHKELPAAISALMKAHLRGVEMLLRQFPDWNRFVENALAAQLDESEIASINLATKGFVAQLETRSHLVDPEVPKVIRRLNEMIERPSQSMKRAAFALIRTLENLVSKVYQHCISLLEQTTVKTIAITSTAAATLVAGWLVIAATGADTLGPLTRRIPELEWLRTVSGNLAKRAADDIPH